MSKFPPCTLNYGVFRDGDVFLSHGCDFIGWLIRVGQNGHFGAFDLSEPNHAGFLYSVDDQWFAAEVGINGIELHSLDEYCKTNNQIVAVMRWHRFDDPVRRQAWRSDMARWIRKRQDSGYDINGAIKSAIHWWPWGNDPNREFCSEDVCAWLIRYGAPWLVPALDPLMLYDSLTRHKDYFTAVLGYKNIQGVI